MTAQATLFHPFAAGLLDPPGTEARVLFLGAEPGFSPPDGFEAELLLVQGFRPAFLALQREGWPVAPQASGENFACGLMLCGRHRGENEARLAELLARVRPGGLVAAAGAKADGMDGFSRRAAELLPLEGRASKHHGIVFWLRNGEVPVPGSFAGNGGRPNLAGFLTAPGMFSHERADPGSVLLADHLPADLKGAAADFGAGWGFLAVELAKRCPKVEGVDLFEADWPSLEAAKVNWSRHEGERPAGFFWHDLLSEKTDRRYDAIVMNPPFHRGRAAEPRLGQGMIAAAAAALKPGGKLFLVANRGLPYEAALQASFSTQEELVRDKGYKVLVALR